MNLIDAHVTEVLERKEFDANTVWKLKEGDTLYGKTFVQITVSYWDDGGDNVTDLIYEKGTEPDVKPGFVFQH